MTKIQELKDILAKSNVNCNVAFPMIDAVVAEVDVDVDAYKQVATPMADPVAGEVAADTEVTLTCATDGAVIHFTIDGSTPDATDPIYSAPIIIDEAKTIKAIAYKGYQTASAVLTAAYTIAP